MRALVLTGVYGTGKTSLAVEIADLLAERDEPHAVLDLDWLMWYSVPGRPDEDHGMMLRNLAPIPANYREAGVRTFVCARALRDRDELGRLRAVLAMPVSVVRLVVDAAVIEHRLAADVTAGRADDLRVARQWLADGTGAGLEDLAVENVGPIRAVAARVLTELGWDQPVAATPR